MPRPTMTAEVRKAREMRKKGETANRIAGELERGLNWVFKHTAGFAPDKSPDKRVTLAISLRETGMPWGDVARKTGYNNRNTVQAAVCREQRRQKEMLR